MQQNQLHNHYLQDLPQPNPIQQKTLVEPKSITPLIPLPLFTYSKEINQLATCLEPHQIQPHILKQTHFSQIFASPVYQANHKYNPNASNLQFACLKAFYSQSGLHLPPFQTQNDNLQIQFQSRFESGNLAYATKAQNSNEYYLLLQKDINTTKCTQWFFFSVKNKQFTGRVKFHILNLIKSYSSFENGMKVSVCSRENSYKWMKGCEQIRYVKNNIKVQGQKTYYTLSFCYEFMKENDVTYLAHSIPYTFSMLDRYLLNFTNSPVYHAIFKRKTITESPGGNYVDLLTITNFASKKQKKIVTLTSRIHPGETPSSFVIEGIITFLLSNHQDAKKLRQQFIFKIIPMLNPDGVINGSYRCSLSGYDLNRVWHYPSKSSSPQIYFSKRSIVQLRNCFLFVDLHAHSKKKGVFMYGCQNKLSPYLSRHFPYLLWKEVQYFNYYQCNFGIKIGRQGTARLTFHTIFNLPYSYTMEYSFCSPVKDKYHFMPSHYEYIGKKLCMTLKKYFCSREQNNSVFNQLYANKQLMKVGSGQDASSSDDSQLDQPQEFKELLQSKHIYLRKNNSVFKQKISEIFPTSTTKIQAKTSIKLFQHYKHQKILNSFTERVKPENLMTRKLLNHLPQELVQMQASVVEMRGQQVFLSARVHDRSQQKTNERQLLEQTHFKMASRYDYEQVEGLNNLFLPSLTSASYKKYNKKTSNNKGMNSVGKKILQQKGLLKEQIRSYSNNKKKFSWKQQILSYF